MNYPKLRHQITDGTSRMTIKLSLRGQFIARTKRIFLPVNYLEHFFLIDIVKFSKWSKWTFKFSELLQPDGYNLIIADVWHLH